MDFHKAMEFHKCLCAFFSFLIHANLLWSINLSMAATFGNETDRLALLAFKDRVTHDPLGVLSSWNDSSHFCKWSGITCSPRHQRVTILNLNSQRLEGTVSPYIGNLTFLRGINLRYNNFTGEIPHEISRLFRLQHLNLTLNLLQGKIPISLTNCTELRFLDLVANELVGEIPLELGTLGKLVGLGLAANNLTGTIPSSLANISSLAKLSLSENSLSGNLPRELGKLFRLEFFQVSANQFLTGTIPTQMFNISSIYYFGATQNQLYGNIPPYIGLTLPNLQVLLLGGNRFSGSMPDSISNASGLVKLDFDSNYFSGPIPANLGILNGLTRLNFGRNQLGTGKADDLSFLPSLVNCSNLEVLGLNNNNLAGHLPNSIANLSSRLSYFYIGANQISGGIPTEIDNLIGLMSLGMEENLLTGSIPVSFGKLPNLQILSMFGNTFSGEIPSSIGNISVLTELNLYQNNLQGSIPPSLGDLPNLKILSLPQNKLMGTIPKSIVGLSSLSIILDLSQNSLTGQLPSEVGNLNNIRTLNLSANQLSGQIPSALQSCLGLEALDLSGNFFQGPIPQSLSSLRGIQELDLSHNNISGRIPEYLETFIYLRYLNLSSNDLEGDVPKDGIFKNASAFSILGNNKLCGGIPELSLPICPALGSKKRKGRFPLKRVTLITGLLACLILFCSSATLFWRRKARKKFSPKSSLEDMFPKVSYDDLLKATDGFSSANLIGVGSYGSVYKGFLGVNQTAVAVKVLNLQQRGASKSFMAECEALRSIRHRNLIKIFTSCSSVDFKGNDFKALVFAFMPNGSLDKWLHPTAAEEHQPRYLSFLERLNIGIDVAYALDYLHHHCRTPIAHCDLKPSNVLLDNEMIAHVGDFGLARFLSGAINGTSQNQSSSIGIKGSIGYVAPEYGMGGEVWTQGDVYSYGILLLEMFTGRRPTDDMFKDGLSLHNFAKMSLPDQVMEIIDPVLLQEADHNEAMSNYEINDKSSKRCDSLIALVRVGVLCSTELPRERMNMGSIVTELQAIEDTYLGIMAHRERPQIVP